MTNNYLQVKLYTTQCIQIKNEKYQVTFAPSSLYCIVKFYTHPDFNIFIYFHISTFTVHYYLIFIFESKHL